MAASHGGIRASGLLFADVGYPAVGTTSLGVTAALGQPGG